MAQSMKQLFDAYQNQGGTRNFADFSEAYMAKKRAAQPARQKADNAAAKKANALVSGNFEKKLRKPIKRKYRI